MLAATLVCLALTPGPLPPGRSRAARPSVLTALRASETVDQAEPDVDVAVSEVQQALAACEFGDWDERANWALEDSVPKYSLDGGRVVLWRRMSLEVPELLTFSADELRARWLATRFGA